jgi:hypothetical protein
MNTTFKSIFATCLLLLANTITNAQVGVGTTSPNASARFQVDADSSTNAKGFLPPRVTYAQRNAITSPAIGLMVFCTNCGTGEPQFYNGTEWKNMIGGTGFGQAPAVASTIAASNISKTSVTSGGNITNDNGLAITARGVCWSISSSPTTANSKTIESGTTGSFTSNITGLNANTVYYLRAYAINAGGTNYGDQVSVRTTDYAIGESALGGKIAYLLQPGDPGYDANITHGLVATNADISTSAQWGCQGILFSGAGGAAIGTGNQNTIDITAGCSTAGIAARLCADLVEGGYSDWFLPSKDELNKLYLNRVAIGGFSNAYYWSSMEYNSSAAWVQNFGIWNVTSGYQNTSFKNEPNAVRAVRAF